MRTHLLTKLAYLVVPMALLTACGNDEETKGGGGGTIDVNISGEDLAINGIAFPQSGEVVIVDGWEWKFDHVLVTVDKVTLSQNPDKSPSDQSQTDALVAELDGPWAIDLHVEGTATGAGGEGKATPITKFVNQNKNGGAPFGADRYAFGYDIVKATDSAQKINFDADADAAYADMIAKGYSVLYVGTATFKGGTSCTQSDSTSGGAIYDFGKIPATLKFKLGFATPVTNKNCQNQDNQGQAFGGENYQRGIAVPSNAAATAQMTLHLDHPLFSDVAHDSPLYFDEYAAQLVSKPADSVLTIEDLIGVDPTAITDGAGTPIPWRVCDGSVMPTATQRGFGAGTVPVNPSATPDKALRDLRDYVQYTQSTQGHLNGGEGLCYVQRNYPSPP